MPISSDFNQVEEVIEEGTCERELPSPRSWRYPFTCFPCGVNSFFQYGSCLLSVVPGRFEIPLPPFGCSRVRKLAISAILEDKGSVKKVGRYASS